MQIDSLIRYLTPELQAAPDELLRVAVVQSVQTLCSKAHVWRELQDPTPLQNGVRDYQPDVPPGARIVNIESIHCGAVPLTPLTLSELSWRLPDWQTAQSTSPTFYVGGNDWGSVDVYPLPKNPTESLVFRVEFEPLITATSLPDFLLQRYQDEISMGVKARCMVIPNTNWSDIALAEYWRGRFDESVASAAIKMIHERNSGSIRVKPRAFA